MKLHRGLSWSVGNGQNRWTRQHKKITCIERIRGQDWFGDHYRWKLEGENEDVNSLCGALLSILISLLVASYAV